MILVDSRTAHLVKGYDRVRQAESALPTQWRQRLLAAYARGREGHQAARTHHRQQMRRWLPTVIAGLMLACLPVAAGLLLGKGGLATALLLLGAVASVALVAYGLWAAVLNAPKRPAHPLRGRLRRRLFPPLLPLWRSGLEGRLPEEKPYEGAEGEYRFVALLRRLRRPGCYLLYRLQQRPGDDLDVTVVGPIGVWTFEVKFWSGTVAWHGGLWEREKSYYKRGGQQVTEPRPVGEAPEKQWQRMARDAAETLRRRDPWLVAELPDVLDIHGGVVFSHAEAEYEIDADCPFAWGTVEEWVRQLRQARTIPGLGEREVLRLLDALLVRHHQVGNGAELLSMDMYAGQVIEGAERRLDLFVKGAGTQRRGDHEPQARV